MAAPTGSYQVIGSPRIKRPTTTATMGVKYVTLAAVLLPAARMMEKLKM